MSNAQTDPLLQVETTCGSLLYELQIIWDEVGESDAERDKMLLDLEQECLEVYRRKVDLANRSRAQLRQAIADSEAELAAICSAMGERPVHIRQSDQNVESLKEELRRILPQLEEMRKRKSDRRNQFLEVQEQILEISNEIYGVTEYIPSKTVVDESDLSLRKLEELQKKFHDLQKEKSDRLRQIHEHLCTLTSLCSVLGVDFKQIVTEVHSSLVDSESSKSMSNDTIEQLAAAIRKLREVKLQRMQRLQDIATNMLELWNLMDTPIEEQQMFQNVTCNIAASEHEITEPNSLSVDFINYVSYRHLNQFILHIYWMDLFQDSLTSKSTMQVEAEVSRLEELKASKMKELVLKKRSELEEFCRRTHMVPEVDSTMEDAIDAIESGAVDPAYLLEQIELQIAKVKEEAFSRKEILEKVEKWLAACDEESWLEEYNRDENRYNAGRGAHLTLKRAEKARSLVNKLPGMVDALASKTMAWEKERGIQFTYDGIRLLSMLEEYTLLREEKEQERRRQRDQKKLQGQLIAEQEALYGSKPSPSKTQSVKKAPRMSTGSASSRRLSVGGAMIQTPKATPNSRPFRKSDRVHQNDLPNRQDDCYSALSAGRRGLDISGLPMKKHSFGAGSVREAETPTMRVPFSPISSTASSKTNMTDDMNNMTHSETLQKTLATNNLQFVTPSKTTFMVEDENKTPNALAILPVPSTPSTVSVPMQTTMTPAPPPVCFGVKVVEDISEEIEYSFEERRAGFVLPKTHIKSMVQV